MSKVDEQTDKYTLALGGQGLIFNNIILKESNKSLQKNQQKKINTTRTYDKFK